MKYDALLLDMNGVLVDDEHLHEEAFRRTFAEHDIPLSPDDYKTYFAGRTDVDGLNAYFGATSEVPDDIGSWLGAKGREYHHLAEGGVSTYDGVREFAEEASRLGMKIAVVTSSNRQEADALLNSIGITSLVSGLITAEDVDEGKPNPQGYLKAASQLDTSPERCLVIEDAPSGIEAANKAGMFCVAITNTHNPEELAHANKIVSSLEASLLS